MSALDQFKLFAEYNRLMNRRILASAGKLDDAQLKGDRGAFFKSVLGTLNHILVGDIVWLKRFRAHPPSAMALEYLDGVDDPKTLDAILFDDLDGLAQQRASIDEIIIGWISGLSANDLGDTLRYRSMAGVAQAKRVEDLVAHLFLHQVHHRGQVTTLLSQSGVDFGDTDILEILDDRTE